MTNGDFINVDGKQIPIEGEKNLLELIRKAGIDIPTFCYHSELSIYGACRLCIVDVEGMGIITSCSTPPRPGMVVRTNTKDVRETRKVTVELLLADHNMTCPTCAKNGSCQLQALARRMGIREIPFKPTRKPMPIDDSNPSLVRDPNRCVLCGDCVRMCTEVQGIAAIGFANRGANVTVGPAYGKGLDDVACVFCGQCARVCPTGAITPKQEVEKVWGALHDAKKTVVAQVAPAVRVALGESFGMEPGMVTMGKIVASLRAMGFDKVYDTSFTADLTVFEEANEFLNRVKKNEDLPQFTSCCPGWVRFAEQSYPELLAHISSCRSPQAMFGALAKDILPAEFNMAREDLVVVSIMPCTAKKYEAQLDKFKSQGQREVDFVLTTQELARMIEEAGLDFRNIEPDSLDQPFGFKSGAAVLFGVTGGVSEAVLRYAVEKIEGVRPKSVDFHQVRGEAGIREATLTVGGKELRLAVVHGLANARALANKVRDGECDYHLIEVMACPGGCVGGAGQPVAKDDEEARGKRARGLYANDKDLQVHTSQENPYIGRLYAEHLGEIGGHKAHALLHTGYQNRRRLAGKDMSVLTGSNTDRLEVSVCVGTSCHVRGAQKVLSGLVKHVADRGLEPYVDVKATFCMESCDRGPSVKVAGRKMEKCTLPLAVAALEAALMAAGSIQASMPGAPEGGGNALAAEFAEFLATKAAGNKEGSCNGCSGCQAEAGSDCLHE